MAPEQGATLPGMTVVCGDAHVHARRVWWRWLGIGCTSEVEHADGHAAPECEKKMKSMLIRVSKAVSARVTAKDIATP